jgi:hypothetical protein
VHICRKWRRIVFASQRSLHLRLFCAPGTPVLKTLHFWPALPIVVQYGGSPASYPPAPEDEENVMAALKQSDRVSSISLTVTKPLLEKLSAIERPFSELEDLVLLCGDDVPLTLSSDFQWGPRLHTLHLTKFIIPALLKLLLLSTGLVDLQLHENSDVGYISPETFADALSRMSHLRTLSLHFRPSILYPSYFGDLPSKRVILPALTSLKYRGPTEYLDSLAASIDAPRLGNINITFFRQPPPMDPSQLGQFINRIAMQNSHHRADIRFSEHAISISFTQPESPTCLELQVSWASFSQQLLYMARICSLYSFLFGIEHLSICAQPMTSGYQVHRDFSIECKEWKQLLRLFRGTKWAYVACGPSTDIIIFTLRHSEMQGETLLPVLHKLSIQDPDPAPYLQKAVGSFMHSRLLSGHMIAVEYERLSAHELDGTGTAFVQCQFLSLTNILQLEQDPQARVATNESRLRRSLPTSF